MVGLGIFSGPAVFFDVLKLMVPLHRGYKHSVANSRHLNSVHSPRRACHGWQAVESSMAGSSNKPGKEGVLHRYCY
jgi:hypothetical protein